MDINRKIQNEVEKTIYLLDKLENIEPSPFLYTRIKARLKSVENVVSFRGSILKISKQIVLALLFLLNVYSIASYITSETSEINKRQEYIKNIASEYSLNNNIDYITNIEGEN